MSNSRSNGFVRTQLRLADGKKSSNTDTSNAASSTLPDMIVAPAASTNSVMPKKAELSKEEAHLEFLRAFKATPSTRYRGLRSVEDGHPYQIAKEGTGTLLMGRDEDTHYFRQPRQYQAHRGRISNPEGTGYEWTLEWNMAFWLGGIEALRIFELVSMLSKIVSRAQYGLQQMSSGAKSYGLGGTVPEMLWLLDCGYAFLPSGERGVKAHPPAALPSRLNIDPGYNKYNTQFAHENVEKVELVLEEVELTRSLAMTPNPPRRRALTSGTSNSILRQLVKDDKAVGVNRAATATSRNVGSGTKKSDRHNWRSSAQPSGRLVSSNADSLWLRKRAAAEANGNTQLSSTAEAVVAEPDVAAKIAR